MKLNKQNILKSLEKVSAPGEGKSLVEGGNTVLLIEHHLDLIKNADWVIDLGPGPGISGGQLVVEGTPEQIVKNSKSQTANFLKAIL